MLLPSIDKATENQKQASELELQLKKRHEYEAEHKAFLEECELSSKSARKFQTMCTLQINEARRRLIRRITPGG
jgi:hypothetical protein